MESTNYPINSDTNLVALEAKEEPRKLNLAEIRAKLVEIVRPFIPLCMKYKIGEENE